MNKLDIKILLKGLISRTAREQILEIIARNKFEKTKLIMTLLVKNEENIIETNIRFHAAMGVDGFIVTSQNSTDKTNDILEKLKKEGLVLDIIYTSEKQFLQTKFVKNMINIATNKYKADWIINADADEFYYSKSLNLKKSILKDTLNIANVLIVDSIMLYPDDKYDYLNSTMFVTCPFTKFRAEMLGISSKSEFMPFIGSQGCTKVIHSTKGNPNPSMGNHDIKIRNKKMLESSDIQLFHYNIRNFKQYEEKVIRWRSAASFFSNGTGQHIRKAIEFYEKGELKQIYDSYYGKEMRNFLISEGVVSNNLSVINFLKYNKIYG